MDSDAAGMADKKATLIVSAAWVFQVHPMGSIWQRGRP